MTFHFVSWLEDAWKRWTASKYLTALEAEVQRLRAENRALLNSILGVAGIPPVMTATVGSEAKSSSLSATTTQPANEGTGSSTTAPLRRRSWQQINKTLEIESARKQDPATKIKQ